jgi:hypothetical protein
MDLYSYRAYPIYAIILWHSIWISGCGIYLDQFSSINVEQIIDAQSSSTEISAFVGEQSSLYLQVKNRSPSQVRELSLELDSSFFQVNDSASDCFSLSSLQPNEICEFIINFQSNRIGTYEEIAQLKLKNSNGLPSSFSVSLKAIAGLNWRAVGSEFWEDIQNEINHQAGQGSSGAATVSYVGPDFSSSDWLGGVLAPNGKIYGVPYDATTILEFDPQNFNNSREITPNIGALTGSSKYVGGVLATNGKIYFAPYSEDRFLELDPENPEDASKVGPVLNGSGCCQCHGTALAPNGKIYCVPEDNAYVLEFNPEDPNSSRQITDIDFSSDSSWEGLRLAPNGKLYAVPDDRSTILEIDARTDTVTLTEISTSPPLPGSTAKWEGASLLPNGQIVAFPENAGSGDGLLIDPDNPVSSYTLSWGLSGGDLYSGGTLAANGKVYANPSNANTVLEVDPTDISNPVEFGSAFGGGVHLVHAPNGKLYGMPSGSSLKVMEVDPKALGELDLQILLHPLLNGY